MKLFDDQDLIAYHLHELPTRRARALERALATDPALAAASEEFATTLRVFKQDSPLVVEESMLERNWRALRPSLPVYRVRPSVLSRWRMPALVGAGLALTATTFFVVRHHAVAPSSTEAIYLRAPSSTVPVASHEEDASAANAPSVEKVAEEVGTPLEKGERTLRFVPDQVDGLGSSQPRVISALPPVAEPVPVLRLIPLASVPPAPVAIPPSQPLTLEPVDPVQTGGAKTPAKLKRVSFQHEHPPELTLAMGGTLIGTREFSPGQGAGTYTQSATHAVSAIASFHQQLRPAVGYRVTVSYTRPEFMYSYSNANISLGQLGLSGRVYEAAMTYVVQGPHSRRLSTSVDAGAGLMEILAPPQSPGLATTSNVRVAGVAGVAAEYAITKHIGVHAAYRFQAFKVPDFGLNGPPVSSVALLSHEPSVGITYRFSHK